MGGSGAPNSCDNVRQTFFRSPQGGVSLPLCIQKVKKTLYFGDGVWTARRLMSSFLISFLWNQCKLGAKVVHLSKIEMQEGDQAAML